VLVTETPTACPGARPAPRLLPQSRRAKWKLSGGSPQADGTWGTCGWMSASRSRSPARGLSRCERRGRQEAQGQTLQTQRWRHGRTVVSRGADMQMTHLRWGVRRALQSSSQDCRSTNSVGFSMSQPYISLSSKALRRGAEPSAGVSCKRSHELREGLQREGRARTSYSSFCLATEVLRPASREPLNVR
jgi:hypothetical protein